MRQVGGNIVEKVKNNTLTIDDIVESVVRSYEETIKKSVESKVKRPVRVCEMLSDVFGFDGVFIQTNLDAEERALIADKLKDGLNGVKVSYVSSELMKYIKNIYEKDKMLTGVIGVHSIDCGSYYINHQLIFDVTYIAVFGDADLFAFERKLKFIITEDSYELVDEIVNESVSKVMNSELNKFFDNIIKRAVKKIFDEALRLSREYKVSLDLNSVRSLLCLMDDTEQFISIYDAFMRAEKRLGILLLKHNFFY